MIVSTSSRNHQNCRRRRSEHVQEDKQNAEVSESGASRLRQMSGRALHRRARQVPVRRGESRGRIFGTSRLCKINGSRQLERRKAGERWWCYSPLAPWEKRLEKTARVVEHAAPNCDSPLEPARGNRSASRLAPPEAAGEYLPSKLDQSRRSFVRRVAAPWLPRQSVSRVLMEAIASLPRLSLARPTTMSSACVHAAARRFGLRWAFCFCGQRVTSRSR